MSVILQVYNALIFLFLLIKAIGGPLFDAQFCIPREYHPKFLVDFSTLYVAKFGDYMVVEKPYFYVGFAWLELCVLWPLCLANIYGFIYNKSWFKTTCLIHGVSLTTMMVAIISHIIGSDKSSNKLKMVYYIFMVLCILLASRGLLPLSCETATVAKDHILESKKKT